MRKTKKLALLITLVAALVFTMMPVSAAETNYVTVNGVNGQYASIDDAVEAAKNAAITGEITYYIYGEVTATGTSGKYTPDLALDGAATKVNVVGKTEDAKITLSGVYYQRFAAENADLYVEGIILDDDRMSSREGSADPWEFTYITPECKSVKFSNCTFYEGIMTSVDATFKGCSFTIKPELYKDLNNGVDYSTAHYGLWVHNYGNVVVDECEFTDINYGGIKSSWNTYNGGANDSDLTITVTNTLFENVGLGGGKTPLNLDGAKEVTFKDNVLKDCVSKNGSYIKSDIEISTVIETENVEVVDVYFVGVVKGEKTPVEELVAPAVLTQDYIDFLDEIAETTIKDEKLVGYTAVFATDEKGENTLKAGMSIAKGSTIYMLIVEKGATDVKLDKDKLAIKVGETATLTATVSPSDVLNKSVTWESSNKKVATVDENGKVTAVGEGKATITVKTANGKTASCEVVVAAKSAPATGDVNTFAGYMVLCVAALGVVVVLKKRNSFAK